MSELEQLNIKQLIESDSITKEILEELSQKATTSHLRFETDKRDLIINTANRLEEHMITTHRDQYIKRVTEMILTTIKKAKVIGFVTQAYMNKTLPEKFRVPPPPPKPKPQEQQTINLLDGALNYKPETVEQLLTKLEESYRIVVGIMKQLRITGKEEGFTNDQITQKIKERIDSINESAQ